MGGENGDGTTDVQDTGPDLRITDQLQLHQVGGSLFAHRVLRLRLGHVYGTHWATDATSLDAIGDGIYQADHGHSKERLIAPADELCAWVRLENGHVAVTAASEVDDEDARALVEFVLDKLPRATMNNPALVPVSFWNMTPHGAQQRTRKIAVPEWDDLAFNYPEDTREAVGDLMAGFDPGHGGQLLLWHGQPGTGKTFALRALASEWRGWCDVNYITDPEKFFGEEAGYMLDVLLHGQDEEPVGEFGDLDEDTDERAAEGRWSLLVLEDTGELLVADAKERTGQGLARLLNVVDGLIGQGLRILVLVTTNEELKALHPAIARPGRCAARCEFTTFGADAAARWLAGRDLEDAALPEYGHRGSWTLADLFAVVEDYHQDGQPGGRVGFVA